jgi:tetratricopeptide (TPR) repeat protein
LLTELAASNTGLCVISTRIKVADLENYESSTACRKDLEQLEPDAGARLLAAMGVRGEQEDLRLASSEFAGHALALTLLGSYLVDACEGDVRRRGEIARLQKDERLGGHARRVMESYEGWFGAGPELSVLRMLGLFDRPAEGDAIGVLRAPPSIPGLTESLQDLGHVRWNRLLEKLRRARLIAQNNTQDPDTVDAHPLIREYFGEQLRERYPDAWTKGHERLLEYSIRRGVDKPETVEQMTPTFEAVVHACEAGRHSEALQLYRTKILRGEEYYSTYKLSAFGNEMAILYHFFEDEWARPIRSLNEREKAFVLHQVGYCQRARGILPQSVAWLEQALAAYEALGDQEQCLKVTGLLSATYLTLGDLAKALSHARKSVELSDTSASDYDMWVNRTKLADVYHNAADLDHARQLFVEAENFLHREKPHWYLYGFSGFKFMDLLLSMRDFRAVRERGEWMLRWVEENPSDPSATKLTTALANLAIGYSYFLGSVLDNSTQLVQSKLYFDRAFDFLLQTDRQELLVRGWLARGEIALANGELKIAKASFETATSVAERGDMKLRRVDCLLDFARLYLALGDPDSASANLKSAAKLIQETKYFLRTSDLRDLERRIASP